ncbi:RNA polymerase subunit RPO18, partial [Monkeypox virus]
MSSFVTN